MNIDPDDQSQDRSEITIVSILESHHIDPTPPELQILDSFLENRGDNPAPTHVANLVQGILRGYGWQVLRISKPQFVWHHPDHPDHAALELGLWEAAYKQAKVLRGEHA